jgi:multidrug efflux pump subunit AcrA (membrane-fusion protein)
LKPNMKLMVVGTPTTKVEQMNKVETELMDRLEAERLIAEAEAQQRAAEFAEQERRRAEYERQQAELREQRRAAEQRRIEDMKRAQAQAQSGVQLHRQQSESDPNAQVEFTMIAEKASQSGRSNLIKRRKMAMPPSILEQCISQRVQFPLTFEISASSFRAASRASSHNDDRPDTIMSETDDASVTAMMSSADSKASPRELQEQSFSYCGVEEFDGPEGAVIVPDYLFDELGVEHGAVIHLRNVNLQDATTVT